MTTENNPHAKKRDVHLSVNGDLLDKARTMGINLSMTFEQALAEALRKKRSEQWLAENSEAIHAYNEYVEDHGVFSNSVQRF